MKKHLSVRTFRVVMWDEKGAFIDETVKFDDLFENEDDTCEYIYALQEQLDDILDMEVNEKKSFLHNRDDENSLAIIVREK